MKELEKYSMDEVMKFYRKKLAAEKKGDNATLIKLEAEYPDLFSDEFEDFIINLKMSIEDIRQRHGEDFSKMIEPEEIICH